MTYDEMPTIRRDTISDNARELASKNETGYTFARPYGNGHRIYSWEDSPDDQSWEIQDRLASLAKEGWSIVID